MSAPTVTPYRSTQRPSRDSFAQLLRAETTKLRTVRGWVIGLVIAALITVALGLLVASGSYAATCPGGPQTCRPISLPIAPGGEAVQDQFYFVHRPLAGAGSITVSVTSLTGLLPATARGGRIPAGRGPLNGGRPGLQPWSKAGIIIKASTRQGAAYAAMMVTGGHGVAMQYDFTGDVAGLPGAVSPASPRWLRLTRSGATVTGYQSTDGTHWTRVGSVRLPALPATVQAGLFATSPVYRHVTAQGIGISSVAGGSTTATGVFTHLSLRGTWPAGGWTGTRIGTSPRTSGLSGFHQAGGTFTVTGSGDIAPAVPGGGGGGTPAERTLIGVFAGLIAVIVVGVMFMTAEYRRGLIRTTLAASPQRARVLAAKAAVIAATGFVTGLAAVLICLPLGESILRGNGNFIYPVSALTLVRVVAGTAALVAVGAVLALSAGALLRRSAGAVTAVIAVLVLPYILATAQILPAGPSEWLLAVTPAAGFAIEQSIPAYPQVAASYAPVNGYFPLAPWAGFGVLCGYTALVFGLAVIVLRRRDA